MRWLQRVWSRTNLCPLWIESPFLSLLQPSCLAPGLRPMGAPPLENLLTIKRCEQKASAPVPGGLSSPTHPPTHSTRAPRPKRRNWGLHQLGPLAPHPKAYGGARLEESKWKSMEKTEE